MRSRARVPQPEGILSTRYWRTVVASRLPARIPPPRRQRYYGVLAPNAPLRGQVTALAGVPDGTPAAGATECIAPTAAPSPTPSRSSVGTEEAPGEEEAIHRRAARYAWALLLARIYEVFPLLCPRCGGEMRIIAVLTDGDAIRDILTHLGEPTSPPRMMSARGPPLWDRVDAPVGQEDPPGKPVPEYEFDQRVSW